MSAEGSSVKGSSQQSSTSFPQVKGGGPLFSGLGPLITGGVLVNDTTPVCFKDEPRKGKIIAAPVCFKDEPRKGKIVTASVCFKDEPRRGRRRTGLSLRKYMWVLTVGRGFSRFKQLEEYYKRTEKPSYNKDNWKSLRTTPTIRTTLFFQVSCAERRISA